MFNIQLIADFATFPFLHSFSQGIDVTANPLSKCVCVCVSKPVSKASHTVNHFKNTKSLKAGDATSLGIRAVSDQRRRCTFPVI